MVYLIHKKYFFTPPPYSRLVYNPFKHHFPSFATIYVYKTTGERWKITFGNSVAAFPSLHSAHTLPHDNGCCCLGYCRRRRAPRSPAKSKLTCACVSRGGDAQGSGRLPSAAASSPHRRRIDLCRPFNPTRRHLPSAFSTLPPLLPLECYVCGLPSSPPYNINIISYTRHRRDGKL